MPFRLMIQGAFDLLVVFANTRFSSCVIIQLNFKPFIKLGSYLPRSPCTVQLGTT